MATEESSQGAALGPEISKEGGGLPAEQGAPNLDDVLGEFMEALAIIQVVSHVLMDASADAPEPIGFCALALRHGCQMLDVAYSRFDEGLISYNTLGEDDPDDDPDEDWDDDREHDVDDRHDDERRRGRADNAPKDRGSRKRNRLTLVA